MIDALNAMTAWNGEGITAPIDWTKRHTSVNLSVDCAAYVKIEHSTFVPAFTKDGKPLVCVDGTDRSKLTVRNEP